MRERDVIMKYEGKGAKKTNYFCAITSELQDKIIPVDRSAYLNGTFKMK